jgi:hypothetical protein
MARTLPQNGDMENQPRGGTSQHFGRPRGAGEPNRRIIEAVKITAD